MKSCKNRKKPSAPDYGKLKKQVREYDVIRQNIDSIYVSQRNRNGKKERNGNRMKIAED